MRPSAKINPLPVSFEHNPSNSGHNRKQFTACTAEINTTLLISIGITSQKNNANGRTSYALLQEAKVSFGAFYYGTNARGKKRREQTSERVAQTKLQRSLEGAVHPVDRAREGQDIRRPVRGRLPSALRRLEDDGLPEQPRRCRVQRGRLLAVRRLLLVLMLLVRTGALLGVRRRVAAVAGVLRLVRVTLLHGFDWSVAGGMDGVTALAR